MKKIFNKKKRTAFIAMLLIVVIAASAIGVFTRTVQAGDYTTWTELYTVSGLGSTSSMVSSTVTLNGNYKVTVDTDITGNTGISPLTVFGITSIYIEKGVTLTVKGGNGSGTTGGGAGIKLPGGQTLKVYGEGTLKATGGDGGSPENGTSGYSASLADNTTGAGGDGGNGAGAPGCGIGGAGGTGGDGGNGASGNTLNKDTVSGQNGNSGSSGKSGSGMGTLYVYDTITLTAEAGNYSAQTVLGGTVGSGITNVENNAFYYTTFGSGGGGAGGNACLSANIGGAGSGGGGGGGGAASAVAVKSSEEAYSITSAVSGTGSGSASGGDGGASGYGTVGSDAYTKGNGGTGGGVATDGGASADGGGKVYISSTATLTNAVAGYSLDGYGRAAAKITLNTLKAFAYYFDDTTGTYKQGTTGGNLSVSDGVHKASDSCTVNANTGTNIASVTAEAAEGYIFAGWYTTPDESSNRLSWESVYKADFSEAMQDSQTVYVLFKKASKMTASANGSISVYRGLSETQSNGMSVINIPAGTVITVDGIKQTISTAKNYYYTEKITAEAGATKGFSKVKGEQLLFCSEPAEGYFYSGVMIDNVYTSHEDFCQYSIVANDDNVPESITALFSASQTIILNAEGGTVTSYTGPVKLSSANSEYELPVAVRAGYDFKGWTINSSKAKTGEYIPAGSIVKYEADAANQMHLVVYKYSAGGTAELVYTAPAEEGITFSAVWDYSNFPVTLVTNGATVNSFEGVNYTEESGYTYTYTEAENIINLPTAADMTYDGYDFLGWYLYEDFSGPVTTGFSTNAIGGKTFYAKWGRQFDAKLTLEGTAIVGQTLTATAVSADKNITFTYKWYRDGVEIQGETGKTYTLRSEDLGTVISCTATGTGDYTTKQSISCSTEKISNRTGDVLTGLTVTGIAQSGKTLTARISPATVENVTYKWYRLVPDAVSQTVNEVLISGAVSSSYQITDEDVGYEIKCVATDKYSTTYSYTTGRVAALTDVSLAVTEKTEAACGSGASIKIDTQNMSADSYITITIPEGLELTKYPDTNDKTIGAFITSVEKTENEDGTVTLRYYFKKKTNVLGFTVTVEPDYTNEHGTVKLVETEYSCGDVSLTADTAVVISNVTAQPGSGYICPVTDKPADYQVSDVVYHSYSPAIYVNTYMTTSHPNYKEVSMVVPLSLENYESGIQTPVPVFYNSVSGEFSELEDGKSYELTDGEETYTVTYYANYCIKNNSDSASVYTGPALVYALPQTSAISSGEVSDYRFAGKTEDNKSLYLRFDNPVVGEYFPQCREQINIKDDNDVKTTVYYAKNRSNYTSLDVIFYEKGTDSLKLTSNINSLGYSNMASGNILLPYEYSNRYHAYLSYYSKENLITDMTINYSLEAIGSGTDNSKLGCKKVYICYPDSLKEGTTYKVELTYADGSVKTYNTEYSSAKTFTSTEGKEIVNVKVTYKNSAENGGALRGAAAEMMYCDLYNELNLQPDSQAEADGYINAAVTEITYVNAEGGASTKTNPASAKSGYHFQHTEEFIPKVPTLNPSSLEVGDTVTINYTFGNSTNPGATYNPDAYMIMPKGYLYEAGSYQKNADSSYKAASVVQNADMNSVYTTDGILPETQTLLETGKDSSGNTVYQIYGRSITIDGNKYNVYSISYADGKVRSGYRTLGLDFTVGDYISVPKDMQVTLPYALYFDNGQAEYEAAYSTAFIAAYDKDNSSCYISEAAAGYDINGDGDTADSFAKPAALPEAALSVSYVMVIDGQTDQDFYKVNETGTYTAVIFNRTSDSTGEAEITIDLARNTDAGSEFNMILQGPVTLRGEDIVDQQDNVLYYLPHHGYLTAAQINAGGYSYEDVTQLKISCNELKTGSLNTITFDFVSRNITTGQDEIAGAYVPTTVTYSNSSSGTGTYTTTVPCEIEAARLELTGISVEESESDKGQDVYYIGDTLTAVNPMSELSTTDTDTQATFTYQWYRDDVPIDGATAQSYVLQNADYGHTVYCMITGTGDYYSSVKSGVVNKIAVDLENTYPEIDTNIYITGNTVLYPNESQRTLTANLNTDKYPSNVSVTYQWYRSQVVEGVMQWIPISGATGKTYVLTDDDWNHEICVRAFGDESEFAYVETGYSEATDTITSQNTYAYVKQDNAVTEAKGKITLVNADDSDITYELSTSKTGTYYQSNPQPGTYKIYAYDNASGKNVYTGMTLSAGVTNTSKTINYYSINYETLGGEIRDSYYPEYYMKDNSETLPVNVTLNNATYGDDVFLGWYLDDHYTSVQQTKVTGTEGKALTYYAKWQYTHPVFYNLTNVTSSNMTDTVWGGTTYETTLKAPSQYYEINKDTIEVKVDGVVLSDNEYVYVESTGLLQIPGSKNTGVIDITAESRAKTYIISRDLENITSNKSTVNEVQYGTDYTETLTTAAGYTTPSEITVMRGSKVLDPSLYTVTVSGSDIKVNIPGEQITDEIEIIAKAVKVGVKTHTLTVNYVDSDGNKLAESVIMENISEGDSYSVTSPSVTGYTPDLAKVAGTMDTTDVTINVVYRKNDTATGLPDGTANDVQTDKNDTWVSTGDTNVGGDTVYKDATSNITITVKHQDEGKTVEGITTYAYQILSIVGGNKEDGYRFAVNQYYQEFFNELLNIPLGENATAAQVTNYLNNNLTTNDAINEFLDKIYGYTLANNVPDVEHQTGTVNSTQFTLDCSRRYTETDGYYAGMGYYFFASQGTLGDQMTLTKVTRDMTIYIKSQKMSLEKEVAERDYDIGNESISYTLYAGIPNLANVGTGYKYIVHDTASKGLNIDINSIVIKVSERGSDEGTVVLVKDSDYTVEQYTKTNENDSLKITFDFDNGPNLKNNQQKGKLATITYTALINQDAVVGSVANPNTAYLEYSNDPYNDISSTGNTEEDKEVVYTYGIDIFKTYGTLPDSGPLQGASFQIKELNVDTTEILSFKADGRGGYYKSTADGAVSTLVTDENGKIKLYGLAAGTYMIVETIAPQGYQPVKDFYLEIAAEYDEKGNLTAFTGNLTETQGFVNITKTSRDEGTIALRIVDPTEGTDELPATGGTGRIVVYCLGAVLVISALALLVISRKKGEEENGNE